MAYRLRRAEHLFALKQALDAFDFCGQQLAECDTEIKAQLAVLQATEVEPAKGKKRSKARNAPKFDLRAWLFKMCGVDLTRIDGIDVTTALVVMSAVGADWSKFPDDKHFASWLGLCPCTKITGGKVMSGRCARVANRAAQALKLAAAALRTSQSALGAYYRRLCAHGQAQGRDGRSTQARAADRRDADQGPGVHRPWAGVLRGALPAACRGQPQPPPAAARPAGRANRRTRLKNIRKINYLGGVS